jgi:hypothetical protein
MVSNQRRAFWSSMIAVVSLMAVLSACGPKTINTKIAVVAGYGEGLMKSIGAAQNTVIAAEAAGILPRNQARASVERFVEAATYAEQAADLMDTIVNLSEGDVTRAQLIIRVVDLLNRVSHTSIGGLLPIQVEAVSKEVAALIQQTATLINTINREVLR